MTDQTADYRPGFWTWAGLFVVWLSAAILSFAALRDLAQTCRVPAVLSPLLPVVIDVGAAVSTRAWLSRRAHPDAERFARALTWALLGLTVVGNAAHQGMVANAVTPPWQVAVLVGAIPAVVVGSTVHLAVLLGRRSALSVSPPQSDTSPIHSDVGVSLPVEGSGRGKDAARSGHPPGPGLAAPTNQAEQAKKEAAAERVRQSRQRKARHDAGDHSTCIPRNCPDAPEAVPVNGARVKVPT